MTRVRPPPARGCGRAGRPRCVLEAGRRIRPVALPGRARRSGAAAASTGRPPASASTAAASPCSPSRRCRSALANGLRHALAQQPRRRRRRAGHPRHRRAGGADGRRAARPRPLRPHRHGDPRRAGRCGRASSPTWWAPRERGHQHPRPGQAVRAAARGRRHRPRRPAPATSTASSAPTGRARPPRCGCCSASCCPPAATIELLGERMPRAGRRVLPRVGALIEGPAHYGHLSGRENLSLLDASGPRRLVAHPPRAGRRGARAGGPGRRRAAGR